LTSVFMAFYSCWTALSIGTFDPNRRDKESAEETRFLSFSLRPQRLCGEISIASRTTYSAANA
jgi:hypothetical protein